MLTLRSNLSILLLALFRGSLAFVPTIPAFLVKRGSLTTECRPGQQVSAASSEIVSIEPKEAVKLFGRLAEKYIALDSSGGNCCYSACADCEYRLPGGGYIMADQSAARPKWIPHYESRTANNKEHVTKWSSSIFANGSSVTKEEFVATVRELEYAPPLGGPYVGASAATIEDDSTAEYLFEVIADGKEKLTKFRMSVRLKQLADGEEGLIWPAFSRALGIE
jgi:hypothetical protein